MQMTVLKEHQLLPVREKGRQREKRPSLGGGTACSSPSTLSKALFQCYLQHYKICNKVYISLSHTHTDYSPYALNFSLSLFLDFCFQQLFTTAQASPY